MTPTPEREAYLAPAAFIAEDFVNELFGRGNPNPRRVGYLSRHTVIAVARKERDMGDRGYEHVAECSACYREFRAIPTS